MAQDKILISANPCLNSKYILASMIYFLIKLLYACVSILSMFLRLSYWSLELFWRRGCFSFDLHLFVLWTYSNQMIYLCPVCNHQNTKTTVNKFIFIYLKKNRHCDIRWYRLSNGLLNKKKKQKKKKNKLAWTCLIKKNFSVNVFFFKFAYSNVFLLGV